VLAYKFRLYPSKEEERKLLWTLEHCRSVCNRLLEELSNGQKDRSVLQAMLPKWKGEYPDLEGVYSKTLQYEVFRLFLNLRALAG
jgi:putative transposase